MWLCFFPLRVLSRMNSREQRVTRWTEKNRNLSRPPFFPASTTNHSKCVGKQKRLVAFVWNSRAERASEECDVPIFYFPEHFICLSPSSGSMQQLMCFLICLMCVEKLYNFLESARWKNIFRLMLVLGGRLPTLACFPFFPHFPWNYPFRPW